MTNEPPTPEKFAETLWRVKGNKKTTREERVALIMTARQVVGRAAPQAEVAKLLGLTTAWVNLWEPKPDPPTDPMVRFAILHLDPKRSGFIGLDEKQNWIKSAQTACEFLGLEPSQRNLGRGLGFTGEWVDKNIKPAKDHSEHTRLGILDADCADCVQEAGQPLSSSTLTDIVEYIRSYPGLTAESIAQGIQMNKTNIHNLLNRLVKQGKITRSDDKPATFSVAETPPVQEEDDPAVLSVPERKAAMTWPS